ncbi:MAG: hypothetical protein KF718_32035 [Polyangiaceae bacterium]|nr:hypothetical protein [Polyangiaceae bacterium]
MTAATGGYDRRSLAALLLLVGVGSSVGYHWRDLLDANGDLDALLLGVWLVMAALITWNVAPRRDLLLLAVGLCGGAVIEWWGTTTGLWRYFTGERPPLWILPAWPVAALSTDRLGQLFDRALTALAGRGVASRWLSPSSDFGQRASQLAYWCLLPLFVLGMTSFAWPARGVLSTQVVIALMIALTLHCPRPRRDVVLFVGASGLGFFLEYWGTSRQCWTYYTEQVPPAIAVVAHGFAAVAFARATDGIDWALARLWRRLSASAAHRQPEKAAS